MPEIKHTPGPWYAWDNGDGLMGVGKLHGDQADLFRVTPASRRPAEEDRANLKVASAAPDLLAAAIEVLNGLNDRIDSAVEDRRPTPIFEGIAALSAAIAKATQ